MTRALGHILGVNAALLVVACSPTRDNAIPNSNVEYELEVSKPSNFSLTTAKESFSIDVYNKLFSNLKENGQINTNDVFNFLESYVDNIDDFGRLISDGPKDTYSIYEAANLPHSLIGSVQVMEYVTFDSNQENISHTGARIKCYPLNELSEWQTIPCGDDKQMSLTSSLWSRTIDDIDFAQYSTELASYTDLTLGQSRIAAIDVVRLLFAPEAAAKIIKTKSSIFEVDGGSVMLLSADGLEDDSVRAQEFYLIFEGDGNAQKLAAYGLRLKCWRGDNQTNWQKEPCS